MQVVPLTRETISFSDWKALFQAYIIFYKASLPDGQYEATYTRLVEPNGDIAGFVALEDGHAIGLTHYLLHASTWTNKPYCYLNDLFVNPEIRGKGVGKALILAVKDEARKRDCARLYWSTQYSNKTAQVLYDKLATTDFIMYRMKLDC
jgi:GNAT superfamily N-acetyltransferase